MQNQRRDHEADQRVRALEAECNYRGGSDNTEGDVAVNACMVPIGDESRAVESPPRPQANARRKLVAEEADQSRERQCGEVVQLAG